MNENIINGIYDIWAELNDEKEPPEMLSMVEHIANIFENKGDKALSNEIYNIMGNYQKYGFINGFKTAMKLIGELRR